MQASESNTLPLALRLIILTIYAAAIVVGIACSLIALLMLVILFFVIGPDYFLLLTFIPFVLNALFLFLVLALTQHKSLRRHTYKPFIWLSLLLALPIVVWLNYSYILSFRGL